jgi:large subunit ribosomal protein L35
MPKMRTHKGAQSRLHVTGSGKIVHAKIGKSHLRMHKTARTKRLYSEKLTLSPANRKRLKSLLPYGA